MTAPRIFSGALLAFSLWACLGSFPAVQAGFQAACLLAVVGAAAASSGMRALGLLRLGGLEPGERLVAGATLGLGLASLGVFCLGAAGLLRSGTCAALLAAMLLSGWPLLRGACSELRPAVSAWPAAPLALLAACLLALCLAPPHQYDSLVYHLVLPETYAREGRLVILPRLLYSHFPQNAEMLFTLALLLGSDVLAQMLMWLATVLSACWVFIAARRDCGEGAAWLAAGLLATHTAVMLLATITYVEPVVMLWTCAAVLAMRRWWSEDSRAWLLFSGLCAGLAVGAKYTGGATLALLALAPIVRAARDRDQRSWRRAARASVAFCAVGLAVFLPWLVKNGLAVGNPVFPFFYRLFPATRAGWGAETALRYFSVLTEYGHRDGWLTDLLTLPYQLLVRFSRYGGGMDALGCLGWSLVLLAAPWGAWRQAGDERARREAGLLRFVAVFSGAYFLAWFSTGTVLRFLTAIAPLLALLAAAGLRRLWDACGRAGKVALAAAVAVMTATNLGYFLYVHALLETGRAVTGLESRQDFLSRKLDYSPCAAWSRANLGPNDRILVMGEQRAYYLGLPHTASTVNAPNPFAQLADEASGPAELGRRLRSEGYTALLLVPKELDRLRPALGLSEKGARNIDGLVRAFPPAFQARGCTVSGL